MMLDRLLRDAGAHVDALIDRHVASSPDPADTTTSSNEEENGLMTLVQQPPRIGEPAGRPRRRWTLVAAAAAAALIVAGIIAVQRDDDDPTDIPAATSLVAAGSIQDNRIEKVVFDGRDLWSVRNGSTFLLRMNPQTGEVLESLSLPEAATPGKPIAHDGAVYVPTTHGVAVVNTSTRRIEEPRATGDGEVWSIAFTTDAAWLVRRLPNSELLERWTPDLSQRLLTVDLGSEDSVGIAGVGDKLYLASANDGLQRYDENGKLQATVTGTGVAWDLEAGEDGTLWIADFFAGDLVAVDTSTDTVRSRVAISPVDVMNVAVTPSSVWVTARADQQLVVVDPTTGQVTARAPVKGVALAVTIVNGAAWVSGEGGWAERFVPG